MKQIHLAERLARAAVLAKVDGLCERSEISGQLLFFKADKPVNVAVWPRHSYLSQPLMKKSAMAVRSEVVTFFESGRGCYCP